MGVASAIRRGASRGGRKMDQNPSGAPSPPAHVTIEKTKKKYKARYLVAWVLILLGFIVIPLMLAVALWILVNYGFLKGDEDRSALFAAATALPFAAGVLLLIVTRIQVWWDHG